MLLQQSVLDVMKAWMRVSAAVGESDVFQVEEGSTGDVIDVFFKRELVVEKRMQSGIVSGEAEVVRGFGEGFGTDDDHV